MGDQMNKQEEEYKYKLRVERTAAHESVAFLGNI